MAVRAEFSADTSSFVKEVGKADAALGKFGGTSQTLQKQVGAFDSVLQKAGINIGPTAKAIDEISAASGKTAGELGKLATAGLVVGTAMAAWDFGRAIAGFFKLDDAIGKATASWLGWGDVAAQTAGAQADTIAAANKLGAATNNYATAIAFLTKKHKERLDAVKDMNDADLKSGEAWAELNSAGATYTETLGTMNAADVEAIKLHLANGAQQSVLAAAYGYTSTQIRAVDASLKAAVEADKAWLDGMKAADEEAKLYAATLTNLLQKAVQDTTALDENATAKLTALTDARVKSILAEQAARDTIAAKYLPQVDATTEAWNRMQTQLAALQKEKVGDIDISARQQVIYDEYLESALNVAKAADTMAAGHDRTTAATERATTAAGVYMNQLHMLVDDPKLAAFFGNSAQGAAANTLYGGGANALTPEMAAAMAAGQFINTAGVGAYQRERVAPITINVTQPLGTPQAIASAVGQALMPGVKQGAKLSGS